MRSVGGASVRVSRRHLRRASRISSLSITSGIFSPTVIFVGRKRVTDSGSIRRSRITSSAFDMVIDDTPNKPAAGHAGLAPRLAIEHHWPGVPEPERSTTRARSDPKLKPCRGGIIPAQGERGTPAGPKLRAKAGAPPWVTHPKKPLPFSLSSAPARAGAEDKEKGGIGVGGRFTQRINESSRGIGLRPKSCPGRLPVLPLPRGEGWGEGNLTFPNSALRTPHLEEGKFGPTYFPRVRSSEPPLRLRRAVPGA
jgi:hypothetical protein